MPPRKALLSNVRQKRSDGDDYPKQERSKRRGRLVSTGDSGVIIDSGESSESSPVEQLKRSPDYNLDYVKRTKDEGSRAEEFEKEKDPVTPKQDALAATHFSPQSVRPKTAAAKTSEHRIVTYEDGKFIISTKRANTHLKNSQGNHISAYVTLLELIYNAVDDKEHDHEVTNSLKSIIGSIFEKDVIKVEDFKDESLKRESRKAVSATLRNLVQLNWDELKKSVKGTVNEDSIQKLKDLSSHLPTGDLVRDSLKSRENEALGNFAAGIGDQIIKKLNASGEICFKSDEKRDRSALSKEGGVVKKALYGLRFLNLYEKYKSFLDKEAAETYKSQTFGPAIEEKASSVLSGFKSFYYFCKKKNFRDKKASNTDSVCEEMGEVIDKDKNKYIARQLFNLFDFQIKDKSELPKLSKNIALHCVIIFNAYDNLKEYIKNAESKKTILKGFMKDIIESERYEIEGLDKKDKVAIKAEVDKIYDAVKARMIWDDSRLMLNADNLLKDFDKSALGKGPSKASLSKVSATLFKPIEKEHI